jgi:predicted nucleic acid-binding protein
VSERLWVVNASPLILLGEIGHLHILETLSETLVIPEAVVAEIRAGPQQDTAQRWLTADGHAYIRQAQPVDTVIAGWDLGAGESAVLTWARQHPETEAVLDDRAARNCAVALNIPVRGTLGVLLLAKREGLLEYVRPAFEALVEAGLRITPDILQTALRLAGETQDDPQNPV